MLVVYLLPHGGAKRSFQMPCRLEGLVPGRELEIKRYLPYCAYKATKEGSLEEANRRMRSSVGRASPNPSEGGAFDPDCLSSKFDRKCIEVLLVFFYVR